MHHKHDHERTEQNSNYNKKKLPNDVHVQQQEFFPANRVKYFIHCDVQIISYLCHVEDKISILNL
jgi:hypothetical protein